MWHRSRHSLWLHVPALASASADSVQIQEKNEPPSRSSGVSHAGLGVSSPTRKYRLEESSLDVGFVLWKSSLGKRGGEARVRPSEPQHLPELGPW